MHGASKHQQATSSTSEIEEEWCLDVQHHGSPEIINDVHGHSEGEEGKDIYVAVGKSGTSMDALMWTLKHLVKPSTNTFLYLVHVFPEVHHIPTPLGKFPKEQLSSDQVESYMEQERSKRRELVRKFLNLCSTSKVNTDTVLIESDNIAKAILDLIPILNVRNLVMGTSKTSARKMRKSGGIAHQIVKDAPEYCEVKIISEGKEVMLQMSSAPSTPLSDDVVTSNVENFKANTFSSCGCFTPKFT